MGNTNLSMSAMSAAFSDSPAINEARFLNVEELPELSVADDTAANVKMVATTLDEELEYSVISAERNDTAESMDNNASPPSNFINNFAEVDQDSNTSFNKDVVNYNNMSTNSHCTATTKFETENFIESPVLLKDDETDIITSDFQNSGLTKSSFFSRTKKYIRTEWSSFRQNHPLLSALTKCYYGPLLLLQTLTVLVWGMNVLLIPYLLREILIFEEAKHMSHSSGASNAMSSQSAASIQTSQPVSQAFHCVAMLIFAYVGRLILESQKQFLQDRLNLRITGALVGVLGARKLQFSNNNINNSTTSSSYMTTSKSKSKINSNRSVETDSFTLPFFDAFFSKLPSFSSIGEFLKWKYNKKFPNGTEGWKFRNDLTNGPNSNINKPFNSTNTSTNTSTTGEISLLSTVQIDIVQIPKGFWLTLQFLTLPLQAVFGVYVVFHFFSSDKNNSGINYSTTESNSNTVTNNTTSLAVLPGLALLLAWKMLAAILLIIDGRIFRRFWLEARDQRIRLCEEYLKNIRSLKMMSANGTGSSLDFGYSSASNIKNSLTEKFSDTSQMNSDSIYGGDDEFSSSDNVNYYCANNYNMNTQSMITSSTKKKSRKPATRHKLKKFKGSSLTTLSPSSEHELSDQVTVTGTPGKSLIIRKSLSTQTYNNISEFNKPPSESDCNTNINNTQASDPNNWDVALEDSEDEYHYEEEDEMCLENEKTKKPTWLDAAFQRIQNVRERELFWQSLQLWAKKMVQAVDESLEPIVTLVTLAYFVHQWSAAHHSPTDTPLLKASGAFPIIKVIFALGNPIEDLPNLVNEYFVWKISYARVLLLNLLS